jgi:hypothetical protein
MSWSIEVLTPRVDRSCHGVHHDIARVGAWRELSFSKQHERATVMTRREEGAGDW